jgi:putative addiction module antidote
MEIVMRLEIKKIGNSTGLILPKELLARLRLEQGDAVTITETPDGFAVSRQDPVFDRGLEIARKGMKKYRKALAALAK